MRGSRSAERLLSNRITWLLAVTTITILAASQLLYIFADYSSYLDALYEPTLSAHTAFARILHVVLVIFSVVVFAALACTLGVSFLRGEAVVEEASSAEPANAAPIRNVRLTRMGLIYRVIMRVRQSPPSTPYCLTHTSPDGYRLFLCYRGGFMGVKSSMHTYGEESGGILQSMTEF